MKPLLNAAGAALLMLAATGAQAQDQPRHVPAKDVRALIPKGSVSAPAPTGPGAVVIVAHRDSTGEVEIHTHVNDEFVVRSGRATVLIGPKVVGAKETAPGELRGGAIVGGKTYDLGPGDLLWIPAGLGHQVIVPAGGAIDYLAVKFEAKPAP